MPDAGATETQLITRGELELGETFRKVPGGGRWVGFVSLHQQVIGPLEGANFG